MRFRVSFHPLAEGDLDSILSYIAADSVPNAEAFVDRIEERCRSLGFMPYRGRRRPGLPGDVRELVVERRVVIVFQILETDVVILRIVHGGQDAPAIPSIAEDR